MTIVGTLKIKTKTNQRGNEKKTIEFFYNRPDGNFRSLAFDIINSDEIAAELLEKIEETKSGQIKVEFEEDGDQIKQIREEGKPWVGAVEQVADYNLPSGNITETPRTVNPNNFHNPYNFVPALPRNTVTGELGDRQPSGHSYYHGDKYSGRIAVKLKTVTPLLIPDASLEEEDNNNHKTYPVRIGKDGKPYLPATSIKGMLRTAYEAVTNSRLAVFEDHNSRLAYRMPPTIGLEMVPARIEGDRISLYPGTSQISNNGKPRQGDPMYAAWLPRYDRRSTRLRNEVKYLDNSLPNHKDSVIFWAEKFEKFNPNNNKQIFTYWRVCQIVKQGQNLEAQPARTPAGRNDRHRSLGEFKKFKGYVYITNKNIDNKHDERVFINNENVIELPLNPELRQKWTELITNYQDIHDDEIHKKNMQSPPALNNSLWSRQVTGGKSERDLKDGSLCYAHIRKDGDNYKILNLYPVMITRGLYEMSPTELLDTSLKPATKKDQLSPADRIFGWVNQKGNGSYKGQLRIHSVNCVTDANNAIENFGSAQAHVPLAILGQPKPEQARFYCADDTNGKPLENGSEKKEGYLYDDQGLRGRKVYPHHKGLPKGYWDNPTQDRSQQAMQGHYQEYRRPKNNGIEQKDDQNRSVKGWVKPGTEFTFDIDITNLSDVELGALLWLLSLSDLNFHRLGGGKPLGFGSVRLDIDLDRTDLRSGEQWKDYYSSLDSSSEMNIQECLTTSISAFQSAIKTAYSSNSFDQVAFIKAFTQGAQGFNDNGAIHYPRIEQAPHPEGKAFEWFVKNEKTANHSGGRKLALAPLAQPQSLPINPTH